MDNNGDYSFLQWSESSPQFMSSVQDYGVISGKVDLIEAFFDSSLEFHGAAATRRQLLAEATMDSMSSASAAEISLCQLAAPWINNISPAALEPTQNYQDHKYFPGREEEGGAGAVTAVVLSSCDNAPTNSYSRSASSGESENRDSCGSQQKTRARHPQYYYTSNYLQQDELVSQCSSNPPLRKKEQEHNKLRGKRYDLDLFGDIPSLCDSTAAAEGGFRIVFGNTSRSANKKPRHHHRPILSADSGCEPDMEAVAQVKEMIYRAAALRPVTFGGAAAEGAAEKPRRRNVRISSDPQTVAARHRRERISERLRVLQRLVPGGGRMDTASMLDEAASYLRFLKSQVAALEALAPPTGNTTSTTTCAAAATSSSSSGHLPPQYSDSQFLPFRPMQNLRTRASLQALPCCDHVAPAPAGAPLP